MTPSSLKAYSFLSNFKLVLDQFKDTVTFIPVYKFKNLTGNYEEEFLKKHCYAKGEFCSSNESNIDSLDLLEEGVR